jgi:septal ring factor EnvC (AmiA/AmiB activator)
MSAKSRRSSLGAGLIAAGLALLWALGAAAEPAADRLQQSAEQLDKLRAKIQALSHSVETDKARHDQLRSAVESAEHRIADLQAALRRLDADTQAQQARLNQVQADRAAAQRKLAAQRQTLAQQLRAAYMLGNGGKASLWLGLDDPARSERLTVGYERLSRAQQDSIAAIGRELERLAVLQTRYRAELEKLSALQAQREEALAKLEIERDARRRAMTQVAQRLADKTQRLATLKASERQLQDLLERLKRALAEAPPVPQGSAPFPRLRGRLAWPLRGPLLADYGDPKADGRLQWKGLWIAAPEGTPVHAAAAGRVAYVGWLTSYGLIVVLQHDQGFFTLYGHDRSVSKAVGEWVQPGEVIAETGNTGGYEQSGLYFELRKGTEALDPKRWLGH